MVTDLRRQRTEVPIVPLPWVRLDTSFPSNPKLLTMLAEKEGHRAGFVLICSWAWSGEHGTDGYIPKAAMPFIHARAADAARLVKHGFWHEDVDGWLIHEWDERQVSSVENQKRRQKARDAAAVRWSKGRRDA
jgi:hypothetical protein